MSRVAKMPIEVPQDVEVSIHGGKVVVKGPKGSLEKLIHPFVEIVLPQGADTSIVTQPSELGLRSERLAWAQCGTMRALLFNMVSGVSKGFERKLTLVGVGYRALMKGNTLTLTVGYSHPVEFVIPDSVTASCPIQTEVLLVGIDKQLIGQLAANIRAVRPPEPYKGKGIRYSDENVRTKEAKKK